ncbi:hypothetical protein [Poseidonibacter ostreae]|uniref:Uncharacterized protein n=1 Tax=Poseidonibacter ostreae TaxID=2654171 RepID=A0A6L4WWN5_9BACT|nr:hypothetical protein [Poseidonibacter ostreae]KAB7891446.1 hypothetical protein GBG19_00995 [Poseidonibacter ostreae]
MAKREKIFISNGTDISVMIDEDVYDIVVNKLETEVREVANYPINEVKSLFEAFIVELEKTVELIKTKNISLDIEFSERFEALLCNSSNTYTRALFTALTDIKLPRTIKDTKICFNEYFGSELEDYRFKKSEIEKKEKEDEKAKIRKEKEDYFATSIIWNKNVVSDLTNAQIARAIKVLEKEYNWSDDGILSLKDKLEKVNPSVRRINDNMHKWNRRHYNKLDAREQDEYEEKLKNGFSYDCGIVDVFYDIPKIVFDVLDLEIINNREDA